MDLGWIPTAIGRHPLPIGDALSNLQWADEPFERALRVADVVRASVRWVAAVALAARVHHPPASSADPDDEARRQLTLLRDRGALSDGAWWSLGRALLRPYANDATSHPLPGLVSLVHASGARATTDAQVSALLRFRNDLAHETPPTADALSTRFDEVLPVLRAFLERLETAHEGASLVLPNQPPADTEEAQRAAVLMGASVARGRWNRRTLVAGVRVPAGRALIVDSEGRPLLALDPAAKGMRSAPERPEELFFLDGKGKRGATRYLALPNATELEEEPVWERLAVLFPSETRVEQEPLAASEPFRALASFGPEHAALFFGREADTTELANQIRAEPMVTLTGPSGIGKTSLLRAGVGPALERRHRQVAEAIGSERGSAPSIPPAAEVPPKHAFVYVRPGASPFTALRIGLERVVGADDPSASQAGPSELDGLALADRSLAWAAARQRVLVVVMDQAEELVTQAPERAELEAACAALAKLGASAEQPSRVVLSVRGDFFHRLASLPGLGERYARSVRVLAPLSPEGMLRALREPVARFGGRFDAGLAERMVKDAAGAESALPLLQFAAASLWERREPTSGRLTEDAYETIGGVAGALTARADAVYEAMPPRDQAIARKVCLALVNDAGTKVIATEAELRARAGEDCTAVLLRLVDARLVTGVGDEEGGGSYQLVHEALVDGWQRLARWREGARADLVHLRMLRDAARAWSHAGESRDLLWRGDALAAHRAWAAQNDLGISEVERRFVEDSARQERSRRRRARAIFATALTVVTVLAGVATWQWRAANQRAAAERVAREAAERSENRVVARALLNSAQRRLAERQWTVAGLLAVSGRQRVDARDSLEALIVLRDAQARLGGRALIGHRGPVIGAVFSPDGTRVLTASDDGTARIWNSDGRDEPIVLRGPEGAVNTAVFSPDGTRVVTAGYDGTARVWQADRAGEPVVLRGHDDAVNTAVFSPDGSRVLTASSDGTARIWDADGRDEPVVLRRHESQVRNAVFSPDGTRVVTTGYDGTARVWQADEAGEPIVLRGLEGGVTSAVFSPDGTRVLTAFDDGTARIWNADGRDEPVVLRGHEGAVKTAIFSRDGTRVLTASDDGTARLWNADGRDDPVVLRGHEGQMKRAVFSPDGDRVVTASWDGTARIWNADGRDEPVVLRGHEGAVNTAIFSRDGTRVLTASDDRTARIWNIALRDEPVVLRGHEGAVNTAVFSRDGSRVLTASSDGTARIWDADGRDEPVVLRGHESQVRNAVFSPDGTRVLTASDDRTARLWNADGRGAPTVLRGHELALRTAAFSPDGARVVTASWDRTARIWNADGHGKPVVLPHERVVWDAAFNPDGARVLTASSDGTARVWNVDGRGEPVLLPHLVGTMVLSAVFSRDGTRVLTASSDGTARIWNADGHGDPVVLHISAFVEVQSAVFSRDETRILTASDRTARVWDVGATSLAARICEAAGRNLTAAEWQRYAPTVPYRIQCPEWPAPPDLDRPASNRPPAPRTR